jgi:hypothetical protein
MASMLKEGGTQAESKAGAASSASVALFGTSQNCGKVTMLPTAQPAVDAVNAAARAYRSHLQNNNSTRDMLVAVNPRTGDAQMFSVHDRETEGDARRFLLGEAHSGEGGPDEMDSVERDCSLEMYLNA